jgi:TolB protein
MRADGTRERVPLESELGFRNPAWSQDGQSIAFEGTGIDFNGADPSLFIIPARGGPARRIANVGGSQDAPDWSPDGRLIACESGEVLGPDDIRLVRPDDTGHARITDDTLVPDGGLRQVTRGPVGVSDYDPSWQPLPGRA